MLIPNFKKLARKKSGLLHEADSNFKRENPHLEKHYEFALRIGVNENGEYISGSMVTGQQERRRVSHEEIMKSALPEGYTSIAVMHSHPQDTEGHPIVYTKGKYTFIKNPITHLSDGNKGDFGYAHKHSKIIGVVTPDKSIELGIPKGGGLDNWRTLNPNLTKYHNASSYYNDNTKVIKLN